MGKVEWISQFAIITIWVSRIPWFTVTCNKCSIPIKNNMIYIDLDGSIVEVELRSHNGPFYVVKHLIDQVLVPVGLAHCMSVSFLSDWAYQL